MHGAGVMEIIQKSPVVVALSGDCSFSEAIALRAKGEYVIAGLSGKCIVDLSDVSCAHSVLISVMLCWLRYARFHEIDLAFSGISPRLHALMAVNNLLSIIPVHD